MSSSSLMGVLAVAKVNPRVIVVAVVVTALVGIGYFVNKQRERERTTLSGFFESQPAQLSSRSGGRVAKIEVLEGQAVEAGKTVVVLEANSSQAQSASMRAQADQAQAAYRSAVSGRSEDISRQQGQVRDLEAQLEKLKRGARPEEMAAAAAKLRQADAQFREVVNGPRPDEIARARAALRQSQARLAKAQAGASAPERERARVQIAGAKTQEELARKEAERQKFLFESGAVARQAYERARAAYDAAVKQREALEQSLRDLNTRPEDIQSAASEVVQARAQLSLLEKGSRPETISAARANRDHARENLLLLQRGSRSEDIVSAGAKLQQARVSLKALQTGSGESKIAQAKASAAAAESAYKASIETTKERFVTMPKLGVVDRVLIADGDLVSPGQPLLRISYAGDLYLRVYVPEAQLARVKVSDFASLTIDGVEGEVMAVVESISRQGEFTPANLQTPDERGKQVFPVRLRLKKPDARVKPGMYASIRSLGTVR
jgi:HlyD family secretion protein